MNYTKFDWYKKYPRKGERTSITAAAHNLGNFKQTMATNNKIKVTHYWNQKIKEITNYIKKCKICIRADEVRPIHHAALALDVTGLFERVALIYHSVTQLLWMASKEFLLWLNIYQDMWWFIQLYQKVQKKIT